MKATLNDIRATGRTALDGPQPGGRVMFVDRTVRSLIGFAYTPGQAEVLGLPAWAESDGYDVLAKAEGDATIAERRMMMQTLLRERFGLHMHDETRRKPGYALVLARKDGSLGPQMRNSGADCPRMFEQLRAGSPVSGDVPVANNGARLCAIQGVSRYPAGGRIKTIKSGGARMAALIASISVDVERPVADKTGLDGYYEFTLEYAASATSPTDAGVQSAASLFTALREQLGLALVSEELDVRVLVVDRIHRPTED